MNLRNKATGKLVKMPPSEPVILVGPSWMREEKRQSAIGVPGLTAEEIVRRAEEREKRVGESFAEAEIKRARIFLTGIWVSAIVCLGALCRILYGCGWFR